MQGLAYPHIAKQLVKERLEVSGIPQKPNEP